MARTKGSVISLSNSDIQTYLKEEYKDVYDTDSFNTYVPTWLDDMLAGGANQTGGTRPPSAYRVFSVLKALTVINTITVADYLNVKRVATGQKLYSKRHIEYWVNALKTANQAITHHLKGDFSITVKPTLVTTHSPLVKSRATIQQGEDTVYADEIHLSLSHCYNTSETLLKKWVAIHKVTGEITPLEDGMTMSSDYIITIL